MASYDFRLPTSDLETPMPRTCTHIKTNGIKCGTYALRHHTKCYFHYQWERRQIRRVRLGGPVGMNKNTGIELPMLDSPAAILLAIMDIQQALLDARIDHKSASTLLYSLQLAIQVQPTETSFGSHTRGVLECPELDHDLEMDRARGLRPSVDFCTRCPKQDDCSDITTCRRLTSRKPPKRASALPSPSSRPKQESVSLPMPSSRPEARSAVAEGPAVSPTPPLSRPERAAVACGVEGPAVSPSPPSSRPERAAVARGAEGPAVSSTT